MVEWCYNKLLGAGFMGVRSVLWQCLLNVLCPGRAALHAGNSIWNSLLDVSVLAHCIVAFILFCKRKQRKSVHLCERAAAWHVPDAFHHEGLGIRRGRSICIQADFFFFKQPPTDCPHLSRLPASNCLSSIAHLSGFLALCIFKCNFGPFVFNGERLFSLAHGNKWDI